MPALEPSDTTRKVFGKIAIAAMGYATNRATSWDFGVQGPLIDGPPGPLTLVTFTATMLLAYDIFYYLYHVAQHRYPFLWELHKVHHSAEVMVGITKDRVHPLDDFMNRIWDGAIPGGTGRAGVIGAAVKLSIQPD